MINFKYYAEILKRVHLSQAPKIWNYLKYRCLKKKAVTPLRRYTPQMALLLLTTRCNLNCDYCNLAKIRKEGKGVDNEANLEKIKRIFKNPLFANCLYVDLAGGEPLLIKDLDRIVAYLTKHGHITNIATNGLLLPNRIASLKRAGISRINVSLYEKNRSIMEQKLAGINKIFPVHASFVLLRSEVENQQDKLIKMARFVRDVGCLSLRFWMYRPMGLNPQLKEVINDTHPAYIEFCKRMEEELPGFCVFPKIVRTKKIKKRCPQLWQRIGCDMSGNMIICCGKDEVLPNANLFKNEPNAIFNHPTLVDMRKRLIGPKCDPPDICKTCNLLEDPGW
ncbi:MAG: radical SAM protein [Nanoarchaeota archaeon]|nr:radical SAM protein [Nanoarchaeota archaeon]